MPKTKNGFLLDDKQGSIYPTFTDKQWAEIQALLDAGKTEEAQKVIHEALSGASNGSNLGNGKKGLLEEEQST